MAGRYRGRATLASRGAVAQLLHETVGAPRWIGVLLLPLALWVLHEEDTSTRRDDDAPSPSLAR